MNMKYNRLVVLIENKSGGIYQASLTQAQQNMVIDLISQFHKGTVKIHPKKIKGIEMPKPLKKTVG